MKQTQLAITDVLPTGLLIDLLIKDRNAGVFGDNALATHMANVAITLGDTDRLPAAPNGRDISVQEAGTMVRVLARSAYVTAGVDVIAPRLHGAKKQKSRKKG